MPQLLWLLSAKSAPALRLRARQLYDHVQSRPDLDLGRAAAHLALRRAHFAHRAAVVATDRDELLLALRAVANGQPMPASVQGIAQPTARPVAFLFSGQGSQHPGMGKELYTAFPAFRHALDQATTHLDPHLEHPLRDIMFAAPGTAPAALLDHTQYTQTALFAFQYALTQLLTHYGLHPAYLIGHSIGELTAACISGVLSLPDACTLVATRGRLMQQVTRPGAMVAIRASEDDVRASLTGDADAVDAVDIAAVNAPDSVVISGDEVATLKLAEDWARRGRKVQRLRVSHAFHSPHMDPVMGEFGAVAGKLTYHPPMIPVISNATGTFATADALCSAESWACQLRQTVRFADGVRTLLDDAPTVISVEVGPAPVLAALAGPEVNVLPSARRNQAETRSAALLLAQLYTRGAVLSWDKVFAQPPAEAPDLPTYPFQSHRFWLEHPASERPASADAGFWEAVEARDGKRLAAMLNLDNEAAAAASALLPAFAAWHARRLCQYTVAWRHLAEMSAPGLDGTWMVVTPSGDDPGCAAILALLAERGATVLHVPVSAADSRRDALAGLFRTVRPSESAPPVAGTISLLALRREPANNAPDLFAATAALLLALDDAEIDGPRWVVTQDAVAVTSDDQVTGLAAAMVWGVGHLTVGRGLRGDTCLIDLPSGSDPQALSRLLTAVSGRHGEQELAIRPSGVYARRLAQPPSASPGGRAWQTSGTAILLGASSELTAALARMLGHAGAERVILAGPQTCDPADAGALADLIGSVPGEHPLRTVVIVDESGTSGDLFGSRGAKRALKQMHDKFVNIDGETRSASVSAFIVIARGGAIPGQTIASTAFATALVSHRRALGLPGTMIIAGPGASDDQPVASGLLTAATQYALDHGDAFLEIAEVDWARLLLNHRERYSPRLFDQIPELLAAAGMPPGQSATSAPGSQWRDRLDRAPEEGRGAVLLELVRVQVAELLGVAPNAIDDDHNLVELGFSSFNALELSQRLRDEAGLNVMPVSIYDWPTTAGLAGFLAKTMPDRQEPEESGPEGA